MTRQKQAEEKHALAVNAAGIHKSFIGAKLMTGVVQGIGNSTTLRLVCSSKSRQVPKEDKICRTVHDMCQDDEDKNGFNKSVM